MPGLACGVVVGLLVGLLGTAVHLLTVDVLGWRVPMGAVAALLLLGTALVASRLLGRRARQGFAVGWLAVVLLCLGGRREGDFALVLGSGRSLAWLAVGAITAGWALLSGRDEVRVDG